MPPGLGVGVHISGGAPAFSAFGCIPEIIVVSCESFYLVEDPSSSFQGSFLKCICDWPSSVCGCPAKGAVKGPGPILPSSQTPLISLIWALELSPLKFAVFLAICQFHKEVRGTLFNRAC